jgi:hypothetical protein
MDILGKMILDPGEEAWMAARDLVVSAKPVWFVCATSCPVHRSTLAAVPKVRLLQNSSELKGSPPRSSTLLLPDVVKFCAPMVALMAETE